MRALSCDSAVRRLSLQFGVSLAIAFSLALHAYASDFPGVTVPGQLVVNDRGYSNYTIPLNIATGSGGLTPSLQLNYGGIGTISYLGQGWSLSGLATVYRGQRTVDVDGVSANPDGSSTDALYLDGSRLVVLSVSASGVATLKSIRADYSLIQAFNWSKRDEYFVVKTKAGLTLKLGASANSRAISNEKPYTWYTDEVSDTAGNFFRVSYTDFSGTEKVPQSIDYTGNVRNGTQPYAQLTFEYAPSPQPYVGYRFGVAQSRSKLLTTLVESIFGVEHHRYSLSYKQTGYWPGVELASVDSIYPTGTVRGPKFQYMDTSPAWQTIAGYALPVSLGSAIDESNAIEVADVDGGGAEDLFYSYRLGGHDTSSAFSGSQNGWQASQTLPLPVPLQIDSTPVIGRMLVDLDGDGTLDLVIADSGDRRTFLRKGNQWVEDPRYAVPFDIATNGQKVTATRIIPANRNHPIEILWSNGTTSGALIGSGTGLKPAQGLTPPLPFSFAGSGSVTSVLVDLDCSGDPEMVYFGDDPELPAATPVVYQQSSNHWVKTTAPQLQLPSSIRGEIAGFGLVRLQNSACKNLVVRMTSGAAFALSHSNGTSVSTIPGGVPSIDLPSELDASRIVFADYDADGNPAVAGVDSTGMLVCARWISGAWLNCTNIPALGLTASSISRVIVGDFDGDKRLDVLVIADAAQPNKARSLVFLGTPNGYQLGNGFFPQSVKLASAVDFFSTRFVDLNGDGLADILVLGDSKASRKATAYLNTGTGWIEEPRYALPIDFGESAFLAESLQLIDFNGDGAPDALVCVTGWSNSNNCHILANACPHGPDPTTQSCFVDSGLPRFPTELYSVDHGDLGVRLVDLNADGRIDVLLGRHQSDGTSTRHAWIWDGHNWTQSDQFAPPLDFASERAEWGATPSRNADLGVRIADLNGDRLPDISVNNPLPSGTPPGSAIPCDKTRCTSAFLLSPQGWQRSTAYQTPVGPKTAQEASEFWSTYADVNGDGLDDLLTFSFTNRESHAFINSGTGFVETPTYAIPQEMFGADKRDPAVRLLDVNADGLQDLIRASRQQDGSVIRQAYLNSGNGWIAAAKEYAPDRAISDFASGDLGSKLIDVDGNGNPDLLFGLDSAIGNAAERVTIGNLNQRAGLLLAVVDGLGSTTTVNYVAALRALRQQARAPEATDDMSGYPEIPLNAPTWLVASTKVETVGRDTVMRQFAFGPFALDISRGLPLGPAWRRTTDDNAGTSVETHFLRSRHMEGLVASESTFDASGIRSATRTSYSVVTSSDCSPPYQSDTCYDALPVESESTDFDSASTSAYRSRQHFEYDSFGDATRLLVEYFSLKQATPRVERSTETRNSFSNNLDGWHLGRLTQSRVINWTRDGPPIVTESTFEYDPATGLLSSERANSHTPHSFTRLFERDLFGNVLVSRIQAGSKTRTEYVRQYDREGRFVARTCNALDHCESYRRSPFDGRATSVRNANGQLTHFVYDDIGRTIEVVSDASRLTAEYLAVNGPESTKANFERVTRLNGGDRTVALFDGGGALVRLSKPGFKGRRVTETARYSGDGLLQEKTESTYDGQNPRRWRYTYDPFGHLSSLTAPNGFTTLYESHDQSISKSTTAGPVATQEFSVDRRVVKIVDALKRTVSFHFDAAGRQDLITLANGSQYSFKYDDAGHRSESRDPDRGTTRYLWNEFGELNELRTPDGTSVHMEYDAIGRLVRQTRPEGVTEWSYDHGSGAIGQLSGVHDDHGYSEEHHYGPRGKVSQIEYVVDGEKFLEDFEYSSTGALLTYRAPNAVATTYTYDKNGFVEAVDLPDSKQRVWTAVSYSPDGRVTEARLGDHIRTVSEVSPETGGISRLLMESDGQPIDDVTYTTNAAGYVVSRKDALAAKIDEFSYDPLGQLVGWKQNGENRENYEYDNLGNITHQSHNVTIDYPDSVNFPHRAALAHVGGKSIPIRYDDAGRTVSLGRTAIEYTSDGLPKRISDPRFGHTEMRHGPNGEVFAERTTHGLAEIDVVHAGRFERIHVRGMSPFTPSGEEYTYRILLVTPSGVAGYVENTKWVFGRARPTIEGEPFGAEAARAIGTTSSIRFVQTDLLGSPRLIADAKGRVLERLYFNPWGVRQIPNSHASQRLEKRIDHPLDFGGYAPTGADDVVRSGPRLYSPLLGRFLQPDPIMPGEGSDLGADLNPYMFSRNSPLRYADPSGFGIFDSIGDFLDHVGGAVVGFLTGGPAGAIVGGIVGLHRAGELIDQYWRPALVIAAGVALTVASGGTLGPVVAAMVGGALAGGLSAALYGGSVTDVLQGAVRGAIVGLVGGAAGQVAASMQAGILGQMTIGGVAGGFSNVVEGGSFEQGFGIGALSAGLAALARNYYLDRTMAGRVITRAVIGGTVASVEGGKFENGAAMAAFTVAAEGAADTIAAEVPNSIRGLTGDEMAMAKEMLSANGLDPSIVKWDDVRIINGRFFELDSGNAITPYGAVFMPSGAYSPDYSLEGNTDLFKHEMVHVYQYYRGDYVSAKGFWEQTTTTFRDPYCTAGTQEYEASRVSGFPSVQSCR